MSEPEWDPADAAEVDNILEWVKSLPFDDASSVDVVALRSGRPFAEVLRIIDCKYFDDVFLERIPSYDATSNWRLRSTNIRRIDTALREYYEEGLKKSLEPASQWTIDADEIAKLEAPLKSLLTLLDMLIGAAFLCANQKIFIEGVMSLPKNSTISIMRATQKAQDCPSVGGVISPEPSTSSAAASPVSTQPNFHNTSRLSMVGELEDKVIDLEEQVEHVTKERDTLESECARLRFELTKGAELTRESEEAVREATVQRDRSRYLQELLDRCEGERDTLKVRNTELEGRLRISEDKLASAKSYDDELRRYRDELEELRQKDQDRAQLAATNEQLKAKLKEKSTMEAEVKVLRDKQNHYVNLGVELEEEQQRSKALRQQIGSYKVKCDEKDAEIHRFEMQLANLQHELERANEKLAVSEGEKMRLLKANEELREDLLMAQAEQHSSSMLERKMSLSDDLASAASINGINGNGETHAATPAIDGHPGGEDLRARVLKLQTENARLRAEESEEVRQKDEEVERQRGRVRELEVDVRQYNKKLLELQASLDERDRTLGEGASGGVPGATADYAAVIRELKVAAEKAGVDLAMARERAEQAERAAKTACENVEPYKARISELEKCIEEGNTSKMEYLAKAKAIIDDQERNASRATQGGGYSVNEFNSMRKEIESKDKEIQRLKDAQERAETMHEQEQRLMATSFHSMAARRIPGLGSPAPTGQSAFDSSSPSSAPGSGRGGMGGDPSRSFLSRQKQPNAINLRSLLSHGLMIFIGLALAMGAANNSISPRPTQAQCNDNVLKVPVFY